MPNDPDWWRSAVFYQVYPRSFQDSDGDGRGDLQGIIDRLDYLNDGSERSLGIDAIWICPMFPSPQKDFGYDVSDYCDVDPEYGTLATMDRLIAEAHRRGIRVLLDFVPNHSSDQHRWFVESRSARENPRRDWYYWRDPAPGGGPPNNWLSVFGGGGWEWDTATGQYYLHSFLKEQPDLNWRNAEVVQAMHDVLRFWLRRGIDGFRIDVMGMVLKHREMPDNPPNPHWREGDPEWRSQLWENNRNYPDVFEAVRGLRRVMDEFPGTILVGEVFGTAEMVAAYYGGAALDGLHMAFNFQFINEDDTIRGATPWTAEAIARIVGNCEASLPAGAQPCFAFANHDQPRFITRHDRDGHGRERARAAPFLLLGMRNSPFLYYGEEIGMANVAIPEEQLVDPARFRHRNRDPARTPMQWGGSPGRGFSTGAPWLPFGPAAVNVAGEDGDAGSILSLYRRLVWLRRHRPSLHSGALSDLAVSDGVVSLVRRAAGDAPIRVVINTADAEREVAIASSGMLIASSWKAAPGTEIGRALVIPAFGAAWVALAE